MGSFLAFGERIPETVVAYINSFILVSKKIKELLLTFSRNDNGIVIIYLKSLDLLEIYIKIFNTYILT